MADHDPIERLNDALERRALDGRVAPDREIRELVGVARRLRDMPREAFRSQLRTQLREEAMASKQQKQQFNCARVFIPSRPTSSCQGRRSLSNS